jgi:hypothetical protein
LGFTTLEKAQCRIFLNGPHHAERLVNPKVLAKKNRLLILDTPEHVDSEKLNRHID